MRQLLDLRFGKLFRTPFGNFEGMADLYNVFNSDATIGEVTAVGPSLGQASEVVQGRLLRLGLQWKF